MYPGANTGSIDKGNWGQGPQPPSTPPIPPVTGSDAYPSSSPRIAAEFMAGGRPAPEPLQATGVRPGDVTYGLEVKTPQPGMGFAEWAITGYDKNGTSQSGPKGEADYNKAPGTPSRIKANIPAIVKHQ